MEPSVRLLEVDPDLGAMIPERDRREEAFEAIMVTELTLAAGRQFDVGLLAGSARHGVLVLDGFVVRELSTSGRVSADLVGPEDVAAARSAFGGYRLLPHKVAWTALTLTRLVLLDAHFLDVVARWPEIAMGLVERASRPAQRMLVGRAIGTLPTVDARLLSSLWAWASDWAAVLPGGVMLPVPLSHERLGRLIGAQRQTITAAIGRLRAGGYLDRREDGAWLLTTPTVDPDAAEALEVLTMPILEGMLAPAGLGVGSHRKSGTPAARHGGGRDLQVRIAEQRVALQLASARNEEMRRRLLEESVRLRAESTMLTKLTRERKQLRSARAASAEVLTHGNGARFGGEEAVDS
jgi:CRP-like cAMP-binding protein